MALRKSGQIALFKFPQTDLIIGKLRPSLLIAPLPSSCNDWLVCMISLQTQQAVLPLDEIISKIDADFNQSGLKTESVVHLTRSAVVSETIFVGKIGEISAERLQSVKEKLADWILKD
ncbi:MAG: type II toxin-antitoxin system PemK/MazF family toxin [Pyrinomonadaceae bacterium]|nr:type II toxin-antitoxin system PemK/MazF family toxin [Pyrinomonadaceae bacterium]